MKSTIIFFAAIFFILLSLVIGMYFFYEKPKIEEAKIKVENELNLAISALVDEKRIATEVIIFKDSEFFKNISTIIDSDIIVQVPTNHSYYIYNKNTGNQRYYTTLVQRDLFNTMDNQRIELVLNEPKELVIRKEGNLGVFDFINLYVSSGNYKNLSFCLKWSVNIVTVTSIYNITEKPSKYDLYIKCYSTGVSLSNSEIYIPLKYKFIDNLNERDYINVVFYDTDVSNNITFLNYGDRKSDIVYDIRY